MAVFRKTSTRITPEAKEIIKSLHGDGLYQHQIAAIIGCNQGRISEVINNK